MRLRTELSRRSMQTALDAFNASMGRVRALHALQVTLYNQLTAVVDLTDILRAELMMAVSAFDYFVHELTRLGMLESHRGTRPQTDAFKRFQLPISSLNDLANPTTAEKTLESIVREKHGYLSFQKPDSIADAVRLYSSVKLWEEIGVECGEDPRAAKAAFQLIIERRNQIAHEADLDPSYPDQRWPIDAALVEDAFTRIDKVANAIFAVSV